MTDLLRREGIYLWYYFSVQLEQIFGYWVLSMVLGFLDAPAEARDYSVIGTFTPADAAGACVYCNHCQPCPAGLNVGLINKYYDLAVAGDSMAVEHYKKLDKKASDCISCGHCDQRCPFHVAQANRMKEISGYFG